MTERSQGDEKPVLIAYCRQSAAREHETRDTSLSLESQEDEIRAWGEANGFHVERGIRDHDLVGDDPTRPGLLEMEERTRPGVVFAVYKWDRLARNLILQETIVRAVERRGGSIVSIREPSNKLTRAIFGAVNEDFRDALSDRITAIKKAQAHRGDYLSGNAPYGYRRAGVITIPIKEGGFRDRQTGPLVPDEIEAPILVEIFEQRAAGASITAIVRGLQQRGAPYRKGVWNNRAMMIMVRNPVYNGKATYRGKVVADGRHDALIDDDLWQAVQRVNARQAVIRHASPNDLSSWCEGRVRHGCGDRLYLIPTQGRKRQDGAVPLYPNFACGRTYQANPCDIQPRMMSVRKIEAAIVECLTADLASVSDLPAAMALAEARAGGQVADLQRRRLTDRRQVADRRRARARESWMAGIDELSVWQEEHERYLEVIAEIESEELSLPAAPDPARYRETAVTLASLGETLATADDDALGRALDLLGIAVLDANGVHIDYRAPASDFIVNLTVVNASRKVL